MADIRIEGIQVEPAPHMRAAATKGTIVIWVLAVVMAVTTGLAVATLIDDSTPAPQRVEVPVPVAVDVAAASAMKDESPAAVSIGRATTDAPAPCRALTAGSPPEKDRTPAFAGVLECPRQESNLEPSD